MTTLEMGPNQGLQPAVEVTALQEHHVGVLRKAAETVVGFVRLWPAEAPLSTSEHFGHAEKRNDLSPAVDVTHYR